MGAEIAENGVPPDCTEAYEAAQAKWQAVEEHEMAISDSSDETALLPAWQSYLTWVVDHASRKGTRANATKKAANSSNDVSFTPLEVICLFERAITDLCLHASIWLQMADYLEAHVSADKQRLINTLARAVRNVPWSSEVWSRYALACEAQAWDLTQDSSSPKGDEAADLPITHLSEEFNPVVGKSLPFMSILGIPYYFYILSIGTSLVLHLALNWNCQRFELGRIVRRSSTESESYYSRCWTDHH